LTIGLRNTHVVCGTSCCTSSSRRGSSGTPGNAD
jgi:hypothetical protein